MWKTASPSFRAFARGGICALIIGMDFPPSSPLPEPEKRTTVQVEERENREKGGASAVTTRQLCNFPSSFTDYATDDAAEAKQKRVRPRRVRPSVQIELKLAGSFSLSQSGY